MEKEKAEREAADKREKEERDAAKAEHDAKVVEITKLTKVLMKYEMAKIMKEKQAEVEELKEQEEAERLRKLAEEEAERKKQVEALNQFQRSLVLEHPTEVAAKLEDNFKDLKRYSRTMIVTVLNSTNAPITMHHLSMFSGVNKHTSTITIK